jgi:hypothetical protein
VFGNFPFGGGTDPKALYITGDSGLFKVQLKVAGRVRPVATAVRRASGTFPYVNAAGPRTALRLFLGTNSPADAGLFAYDGIKNAVLFNLLGQRAGRHVPDKAPSAVYILQNKATR